VVSGLAGRLVTAENFDKWAYSNFSPRHYTSATQIGTDWLRRELRGYSPEDLARVSQRVRNEHDLGRAVDRLEALYEGALREPQKCGEQSSIPELAPYLEKIACEVETQISKLAKSNNRQTERCGELEREIEILRKYIDINTRQWEMAEGRLRDGIIGHWVSSQGKRLKGALGRLRSR
jgi:hypothetical protein